MKSIRKPKTKGLPKKPKVSASVESWEKWHSRVREIQKENRQKQAAYNSAVKKAKADKSKKDSLIKKSSSLGRL